jgi:ABC-type Mn2+/Zn2+ transport system permease subunit
MTKKITSFFLLLIALAIYDNLVKNISEYSVNLDVFYHSSIFTFILFWIWIQWKESIFKLDKRVLIVLAIPFILRIGLNLLSINKSYSEYSDLVSNRYIDYTTWLTIVILLILILWEKYITIRQS